MKCFWAKRKQEKLQGHEEKACVKPSTTLRVYARSSFLHEKVSIMIMRSINIAKAMSIKR